MVLIIAIALTKEFIRYAFALIVRASVTVAVLRNPPASISCRSDVAIGAINFSSEYVGGFQVGVSFG